MHYYGATNFIHCRISFICNVEAIILLAPVNLRQQTENELFTLSIKKSWIKKTLCFVANFRNPITHFILRDY